MDIDLTRSAEQFHNRHRRDRIWKKLVSVLCCVVVFCTTYALILPAITMERETICGIQEHQHTESCYTRKDVRHLACGSQSLGIHTHTAQCADGSCGYADFVIHEHNSSCYEDGKLVCPLPEVKAHTHTDDCYRIPTWEESGHTHTDECYTMTKGLSCGKTETEGHTHTDACRSQKQVLSCDTPESDGHHHGEGCYDENDSLTCTTPESSGHHHDASCYRTEETMTCGKEESEPHQHTDACYAEEKTLICTEKEGPVVKQGAPELACTMPEIAVHEHSAACFDADNKWICGKPQILSHAHTDACFATAAGDVLTCELEVHEHTEDCFEGTTESVAEETIGELMTEVMSLRNTSLLAADDADEDGITPLDGEGTTAEPIDFGSYITDATIYKLQNGNWVEPSDHVYQDGDQVKVYLKFDIPAGVVTAEKRWVCYKLPNGVRPNEALSGTMLRQGQPAGTFQIDTEGNILIEYLEAFANGEAFEGELTFQGTVSAAGAGGDGTIEFPGGTTITVQEVPEEQKKDIKIEKTGAISSKIPNRVDYSVTISTQEGSGGEIAFKDWLGENGAYVCDESGNVAVTVTKVDSNQGQTGIDNVTFTKNSETGRELSATLDALNAGEKYIIQYSAIATPNADGSCKLSNSASANYSSKWNEVAISNARIQKSGWYNNVTDKIQWTITIDNCAGYTLTDTIDGVPLPKNVTLKRENGDPITLPYTFGEGETGTYKFTYETDAPEADNSTVTNTATVKKNDDDPGFSSQATVPVNKRSWAVNKDWAGERDQDGVHQYLWNMQVTVPDNMTQFTYTDTIADIMDAEGNPMGVHYAILGQLKSAIESNLRFELTNETLANDLVDIQVVYYDASSTVVNTDDARVQSFTITVTPKDGETVSNAYRLVLNQYPTVVDLTGLTAGQTWTFRNTGEIPDHTDIAEHSVTKPTQMVKQAGQPNNWGGVSYSSGNMTVDYAQKTIYYRLLLSTEAGSGTEDIVVTDTLPDGAVYVAESVLGRFYNGEYNVYSSMNWWINGVQYIYDFSSDAQKPVLTLMDGNTIQIKIDGGFKADGKAHTIAIMYQVSFENDIYWDNLKNESKDYTNSASWNGSTVSQTTTVNRPVKKVSKTGTQLTDENKQLLDTIEYTVDINPAALDLDPGSDQLVLRDVLTTPNGTGAYLDLGSVKLYEYASYKSDSQPMLIDSARYQVVYLAETHTFTITLPDELACVLVYRYHIDRGQVSAPEISNAVSLAGEYADVQSCVVQEASAAGSVTRDKLTIYKVDKDDYSKKLKDAKFKLEKWENSNWTTVLNECSTNGDGVLVFSSGEIDTFAFDQAVLYRLTETAAPEGYAKSDTPFCFVFMLSPTDNQTAKDATLDQMTDVFYRNQGISNSGVKQEDVSFYPNNREVTGYIPNTCTQLSVNKVWVDENGNALDIHPDSVKVQLMQHTGTVATSHTVTVHVYDRKNTQVTACEPDVVSVGDGTSVRIMMNDRTGDYYVETNRAPNNRIKITEKQGSNTEFWTYTAADIKEDLVINVYAPYEYLANWLRVTIDDYTPAGYSYGDGVCYGEVITLNAGNLWSKVWNNLPQNDENGIPYRYTIQEVNPPPGYTVIYNNNNGIQTGEIVVTNKKIKVDTPEYTLPETGGRGTEGYTLGGFVLTAGAALWLLCRRKRRREAV